VTTREIAGGRARIYDFAVGVEAPRSLTLTVDDDLAHTTLFRATSYFLRTQWPGALTLA
jgi:hypothetical protein